MTIASAHLRNRPLLAAIVERIETDTANLERLLASDPGDTTPETFTRWNQGWWREHIIRNGHCGTALCAAGYAVELTGAPWLVVRNADCVFVAGEPATDNTPHEWDQFVLADETDPEDEIQMIAGHRVVRAKDRAARLLGLDPEWDDIDDEGVTDRELHPLFRGGNSLDTLREWLDCLPD